ncbi:GNAT family N-acetyltransferase [Virgibacillus kekensis]|uniref:GNAT family N-acetyltransferase n=1 Tax=Virgibacillus kekensis TaxID=202261 RepID=A0ABV9DMM4_9BACI
MEIELKPMSEEKFNQYYKKLTEEYAADHAKAGNWSEDEAVDKARKQIEKLLPEGVKTKENYLYSVCDGDDPLGVLWLNVRPTPQGNHAYIYDIRLDDDQQGKGYGKATMQKLDEYAKEHEISRIALHVFAHNERAIKLYTKTGYEMTDHLMAKTFK